MFNEQIMDGIEGGHVPQQGPPQPGSHQAATMEQQIAQLQEQINRLGGGYQRQPWESWNHNNLRLYQGSLRSIPVFSGERCESWRSHKKSL